MLPVVYHLQLTMTTINSVVLTAVVYSFRQEHSSCNWLLTFVRIGILSRKGLPVAPRFSRVMILLPKCFIGSTL